MSREFFAELDPGDRQGLREHIANISHSRKSAISFEKAVDYQLAYVEFLSYIVKKYDVNDERDYEIDEVFGAIYYFD